ncbi:hypothetical protein [Shewanella violacea]|uniref:Uncharacterized protein n=1 Tax=Shewanella violacea (strain JCM 10179 / CIP 106290 / LMG 19151 / DSS12) TaxID=637905 RepID=D4ZKM9_SHEVD|nr:hypothetical protein [Shewanella violacea]BAJ02228.1 hypothetical protein SVI_2257 [Shewanella violacea DSS12]
MDMFSDIKSVMDDLNRRKTALGNELKEFECLQNEINQLVERSPRDTSAMAKLIKLKKAFPEGFELVQGKVMNKVGELEVHFKSLEKQFSTLGEIEIEEGDKNSFKSEVNATAEGGKGINLKPKKIRKYL